MMETSEQALETAKETISFSVRELITDDIYRELGKVNYSLEEALSEFIDNSISAKVDHGVTVDIHFHCDETTNKCYRLLIEDNASGIAQSEIPKALTPARRPEIVALNEHGMGLKQSIEALGSCEFIETKVHGRDAVRINGPLGIDMNMHVVDCDFDNGTRISIDVTKTKCRLYFGGSNRLDRNNGMSIKRFIWKMGARYRYFLDSNELLLRIYVHDGKKPCDPFLVESVKPIYFHPIQTSGSPLVVNKEFSSGELKAELTFGYAPKHDNEYRLLGTPKVQSGHPYYLTQANLGLDILIDKRVIRLAQWEQIEMGPRLDWRNQIRGEIRFKGSLSTYTSKNGVIENDDYRNILKDIHLFLSDNTSEFGRQIGGNYIENTYIRTPGMAMKEKAMEDKMVEVFKKEAKRRKHDPPQRQYVIDGTDLQIDILYEEEPYELKAEKAVGQDIAQLLLYMILKEKKQGYLVANEWVPTTETIIKMIEANIGYKINLMRPNEFIDLDENE